MGGAGTGEQGGGARGPEKRRPFVPIDQGLTDSELFASFTAQQRSVVLSLHCLTNWADLPWVWRGRTIGIVHRGELTHALRSIADHAKVTKDVADGVVRALLRERYLEEILGAPEPTSDPTTGATPQPTSEPTYKPTSPRKLRVVHYLRKAAPASDEPTTEPTPEPTSLPPSDPPSDPTEIRSTDGTDGHNADEKLSPSPAAPAPRRKGATPQGAALDHWNATVWPKLSPADAPEPTAAAMTLLARRCKAHTLDVVKAAMDRARERLERGDAWLSENLTLQAFLGDSQFPKFLPRAGAAAPKGAPVPAQTDGFGEAGGFE